MACNYIIQTLLLKSIASKTEQVQSQKIKLTNKQNKAFSLFISKTKKDILSAPSSPAVLLHINTRTITIHYQWQWAVGASSEGKAVFKKPNMEIRGTEKQ